MMTQILLDLSSDHKAIAAVVVFIALFFCLLMLIWPKKPAPPSVNISIVFESGSIVVLSDAKDIEKIAERIKVALYAGV